MISAKRVLTIVLATAVVTPVLGVTAADAASPGKQTANESTPTTAPATATTLTTDEIEARCESALPDTRTAAQVNQFMRTDAKSMHNIAVKETGAAAYYNNGFFGQGVDIALIDSGVSTVPGLDKGNVVNGPDFSWESQATFGENPNRSLLHRDTYFHGTHLAGIMTGRDVAAVNKNTWDDDPARFMGIAPAARTLNVKVADAGGATDITQVIAAIDWVVEHAHDADYNVRVINLSYGLNSLTGANADALSYSVQQAWNAGIVVVAAAGNEGKAGTPDANDVPQDLGLTSPAFTRDIIAVGAYGTQGASDFSTGSSSVNMRVPDFVAWGESLPSLHVPGSTSDQLIIEDCEETVAKGKTWETPLVGAAGRFVKVSGTSQAAALTSGAIALMLSKSPSLTPEQVKKALATSAEPVDGPRRQFGEGRIRLDRAYDKVVKDSNPSKDSVQWSSLDLARGDSILESPIETCYSFAYATFCITSKLQGNIDWVGNRIDPKTLMAAEAVNPKKSPYCLDVSDYVTKKAFASRKCEHAASNFSPTAWTIGVDQDGFVYERWNGGPGLFYTGEKVPTATNANKVPPTRYSPMKWPAPAWMGLAWADMDWSGITWANGGWTLTNAATADDLSKSRLRGHDFTKSRLRGDDFTKSRLRGSDFTKSRLRGDDFTKSRLRNFGWKEFAWS
jgi:subtilisin family serine protease